MKCFNMFIATCNKEDVIVILKKTGKDAASVEVFSPFQKHIGTEFVKDGAQYHCTADFDELYAEAKRQINYHNILKDTTSLKDFIMKFLENNY